MSSQLDVRRHLDEELGGADPWRLDSNPFEQQRYDAMLEALRPFAPFERALEVGCAAGAFTERLLPHCRSLHAIDVSGQALARTAARIGPSANATFQLADVGDGLAAEAEFDLIVVAEVLYYVDGPEALDRACEALAKALKPGGLLVFGSAVDAACRRWGLFGGAETAMRVFSRRLRQTACTQVRGADAGEDCRIVSYTKDVRRPSWWSRLAGRA